MAFLDQNPPSFDNQLEYDKWLADQLIAADADQDRQDQEYEDKFVEVTGDTMTGDLIVNAEVHADVVETLVVDSGENSNLVLKHNGNTKVYVGGSQVTIQNPLKLNTEGTDDDHAVTKKYIDDDQERQDKKIEELEDFLNPSCDTPELTEVLSTVRDEPLRWSSGTVNGTLYWSLTIKHSLHQDNWPRPTNETSVIYVNGVEYPVIRTTVFNGPDYQYSLPDGSLDDLVSEEITVSLCPEFLPPFVTRPEFEKDQQRQDDELAAEIQARAERDLLHDAEINTLEYKLEALIGVTFRGTYEFKHDQSCEDKYQECMANCINNDARCETDCLRAYSECEENSVDPGFFEAIDPDGKFDNLQEIIISKNDKSNVEIDWASVLAQDDYLEVDHVMQGQLDKTNYGLYRILEEPETHTNSKGDVVYVMKLQFLQGDGVLNERELYEIRGITAAEGVNPEELGDFLTKDEAKDLYAPKSHVHKGEDITTGKVSINRLPTGTSSTTVAVGNHGHSGYAGLGHGHGNNYVFSKNSQVIKIWKSGSIWYIE